MNLATIGYRSGMRDTPGGHSPAGQDTWSSDGISAPIHGAATPQRADLALLTWSCAAPGSPDQDGRELALNPASCGHRWAIPTFCLTHLGSPPLKVSQYGTAG